MGRPVARAFSKFRFSVTIVQRSKVIGSAAREIKMAVIMTEFCFESARPRAPDGIAAVNEMYEAARLNALAECWNKLLAVRYRWGRKAAGAILRGRVG